MAAADPLSEKVKNDTEVTADLAIFVALMRRGNVRWFGSWKIVHQQRWRNAQKRG
jgi:hypothetical protein